jgi:serine/threonine-protein kinase HipA
MSTICFVCLKENADANGYHAKCAKALFGGATIPKLDIHLGKMHTAALAMIGHTSLSGVQKKISVNLSTDRHTLKVAAGKSQFILKPPTEVYPHLPENEHVVMQLARLSGLITEECGLMRMDEHELGFLTRRFDRLDDGSKLHQEDFCQLSELTPASKYQGTAEGCAKVVKRFASEPGIELLRLFEQLLFSWWVGNGDLHLKNLSLLVDREGMIRLTPAYDLVSTMLVIENDPLVMPVCGKKDNLKRSTWSDFAAYCGISEKAAKRVLDRQANILPQAHKLIDRCFMPPAMKAQLKDIVAERSMNLSAMQP